MEKSWVNNNKTVGANLPSVENNINYLKRRGRKRKLRSHNPTQYK